MLTQKELSSVVFMIFQALEAKTGCEACLNDVAAYTEAKLFAATLPEALQPVEEHLSVCSDCNEEYEALGEALWSLNEARAASSAALSA